MKLSDYLLISDIDGTLITYEGVLPQRNRVALERFVNAGGQFGIATGRSLSLFQEIAGDLPVNAPCALYNGGSIYDPAEDTMLLERFLPDTARTLIGKLAEEFPEAGVMVVSRETYFQTQNVKLILDFIESRQADVFEIGQIDRIAEPWNKALFLFADPKRAETFVRTVRERGEPGIRLTTTNPMMVEILPEMADKGSALKALMDMGRVQRENLVAIGDYYNDWEMIAMAGLGVTMEDAPEDLKALAGLIVGPCEQGAVADLIEYLEARCEG